jgi:hypothetical protein
MRDCADPEMRRSMYTLMGRILFVLAMVVEPARAMDFSDVEIHELPLDRARQAEAVLRSRASLRLMIAPYISSDMERQYDLACKDEFGAEFGFGGYVSAQRQDRVINNILCSGPRRQPTPGMTLGGLLGDIVNRLTGAKCRAKQPAPKSF